MKPLKLSPEEYLERPDHYYNERVSDLYTLATSSRTKFLASDLLSLKEESLAKFVYLASDYYKTLVLFPDDEIREKFNSLGISNYHLNWLTPIENINTEFSKIEADGKIQVLKLYALQHIIGHLHLKINDAMLFWGGYVRKHNENPEMNMVQLEIKNIIRRRNQPTGKPKIYKNKYDQKLNEAFDKLEREMENKDEAKKVMDKLSGGDTDEYHLKEIVTSCLLVHDPLLSKTKIYSRYFELFKLIANDKKLVTEEAFKNEPDAYESYNGNYEKYKYTRINKIINKK